MSSHNDGQQHTNSNPDKDSPPRKYRYIKRGQAVFAESVLGVYALLVFTGGATLFEAHSAPVYFMYAAGVAPAICGLAIHYRHIYRSKRKIAWKPLIALATLHLLMLVGTGVVWWRQGFETGKNSPKPMIDATPRSLKDFVPGDRAGIGMTFRNTGAATAYSVTSDVSGAILPFPLPKDYPMPSVAKTHGSIGTLAPGGEIDGFGQFDKPISSEQVMAILDGSKLRLYVAGMLSYRLSSGRRCFRHFLWETGGPDLVASIKAFDVDHHTPPPWWEGDRFNDLTPECE
jgi:hypothetical protein